MSIAIFISSLSIVTSAEETVNTSVEYFKYSVTESGISIDGYLGEDKDITIAEAYEIGGKFLPVTAIGEYAFEGSFIESISLPEGLSTIYEGAFYECNMLKSVTLPKSVLSVGDYAFDDCNSLTEVTVLNSKASIGESAFGFYAINVGTNRNPIWKYYIVDDFVLKGYNNSTANIYATDNGIDFIMLTSQILGDINQDDTVNLVDLVSLKKSISGIAYVNDAYTDVNGDGVSANALDLSALRILILYDKADLPVYTVTFEDANGNKLKEQEVYWCFSAIAPAAPETEGYNFTGWDKDYSSVKSDITVKALYTPIMFTVTFTDFDGRILKTDSVAYGQSAVPPTAPSRNGYTFIGWDAEFDSIKASVTITAQYKKISENYTVTFKDYNGTIISSEKVPYGEAAKLPDEPTRSGYIFAGWSGNYSNVTEDSTVTAQYISSKQQNVFKVNSVNGSKGSTVSVTVELTGSVMMNGFELILNYDSDKLALNSAIAGSGVIYNQSEDDQIKISYFNKQCINEYNGRVILTLKFAVLSDESVAVPLILQCADVFDASDNSVANTAINGQVVIN